jgi:hypothetical protein
MTEEEYRELDYNSSSSLKDFSTDRRKYYRKYVLGDKIKEKENKAANMGRLVETILMEPERFDEMFFMSSSVKVPGGMLGDFIYKLAELVGKYAEDEGYDFEETVKEAYVHAGFKIKIETVITKLEDPENKIYYEECLKVEHLGMTMVTAQDITNAEQIVDTLRNTSYTAGVCNLETGKRFEVVNQMKIQDYVIDGVRLKSMLDKVIIDHDLKIVHVYDLKCTWSVEKFYTEYYLYRRSYIQAYLYWKAVQYVADSDEDSSFYGYTVEIPKFLVCDSINYYKPLIYTLTKEDIKDAYEGFTYKFSEYPGVKQIIEELTWAIENDEWGISKGNHDKGGNVNIKE